MSQTLKNPAARLGGLACLTALAVILAACDDNKPFDKNSQIGPNPQLPDVKEYLVPPVHIAKAVGWQNGETPTVAEGLQIKALASGLEHPRSLYALPNGDILVVETDGPGLDPLTRPKHLIQKIIESHAGAATKSANRITLLRDTDGDGVAETKSVFLENLYSPFGVALVGQDLYVANTDGIMHYHYEDGQTKITDPGSRLTDLPGGPIDHHWTKSLVASQDGTKLYVGIGSNSNAGENGIEAEHERAAVWEVDRATGAHRVYASGLRNPAALAIEPQSNVVWAAVNERDELGPDLVPDYMTGVKDGAFYGWPYSYYGQHIDPRVMPQAPELVAKAIPPDYALSSHVAPLGMVFNTGTGLPQDYQGGAFVGEHGSWNRAELNGYKVIYVPFASGKPSGMPRDVVTGFLNDKNEARGRPVGVALDKSGALLVADDLGNTVWRVTATGH